MRHKALHLLLWLFIFGWAIVLGAKVFDLLVLGTAWGAAPPASFQQLPYGKAYPVNPGTFFQPLSALLLVNALAGLAAGWNTPARRFLLLSLASLAVIWIFTPTVFWPMISDLWEIHRGRLVRTDAEAVALVQRWFLWDAGRIAVIGLGFVCSVRALGSLPQGR